jgi:hypothetical protein
VYVPSLCGDCSTDDGYSLARYITLRITYGIEIERRNDPNVELVEMAMDWIVQGSQFDALILDMFPICNYIYTCSIYHLIRRHSPSVQRLPS